LKNKFSVKKGRKKEIVYDNGDNGKEKGGTNTSDKVPSFNNSDKEVANEPWAWATSSNVSLKEILCLKPPN
jgi:hypothetical protein